MIIVRHEPMQREFDALRLSPKANPHQFLHASLSDIASWTNPANGDSECLEDKEITMCSGMSFRQFSLTQWTAHVDLSRPPKRFWRTSWCAITRKLMNVQREPRPTMD